MLTRNRHHRACGHVRVGPQVAIRVSAGRCAFGGVASCGLVWECLVCSSRIRSERAKEVQRVVAWHCERQGSASSAQLLTLTVRHAWGDRLRRLRSGLAAAWRRFVRGAPWKRFSDRVGLVGYVRALEVTHGPNGWHPHLHVVLLVKRPEVLETDEVRWWLRDRWHAAVERELGRSAAPDETHGVNLRPCFKADYISKLGLEVTAPGEKTARGENRTPWEVLADFDATRTARDAKIWRQWTAGIRRARMLTWSRGLREEAGLGEELSDEELANKVEGDEVMRIDGELWDRARDVPNLLTRILEAAERGGRAEAEAVLERCLGPPKGEKR